MTIPLLRISNSQAHIDILNKGIVTLNYAELVIDQAGNLQINSHSSDIDIQSSSEITMKSRHDNITLNDVKSIIGTGYFTKIKIQNISQKANLSTTYGEINIWNVEKDFPALL